MSTHTAMNGGKYYVPGNEFDEFLSAYIEAMNAGKFLSIVEQHRYIGPVIVDIDLRQSVPTRIYDYVDVRMFVKELFKKIAKYVVVPENTQCFVLEKQKPRVTSPARGMTCAPRRPRRRDSPLHPAHRQEGHAGQLEVFRHG